MKLRLVTDPPPEHAAPADFTEAMSAHAGGVVLVTCLLDGRPWGATVTAFASVSADPPTVLVSLRTEGSAARAIAATGSFGVSILVAEQRAVARHGGAARAAGFLDRLVERGAPDASPAVAGALAHLDCALHEAITVAGRTVFFGRVRAARATPRGAPLLYHRREYRELAAADTDHRTEWSTRWLGT